MDMNDLNLSKNRLERFLLRKRGGRSVPTTIEPLVILPEDKLKKKGSLTPFKYALKYAHLDMERWPENQQQQTRKRKDSFDEENAPDLSDEHINKLARKQRGSRYTSNSPLTNGQKFVIKPYIDNNNNNNDNVNYKQSQIKESFSFKRQPMSDKTRNNYNNNNNDTLRQSSPSIQSNYSATGSVRSKRSAIKIYVDKNSQQQQQQQQRHSSSSPKRQVVEEKTSNNDDNHINNNSNNTQRQTSISAQSAHSVANSIHSNQSKSVRSSFTENRFASTDGIDYNSSKQQQEYMTDDKAIIHKNTVHEKLSSVHSSRDSIHSTKSVVDVTKEQPLSVNLSNEKCSEKLASQMNENSNDKSGTDERDNADNIVQEEENHPSLPAPSNQKIEKSNKNDIIMDNGNVEEVPVAEQKDDILDDLTEFEIEYDYGDDGGVFVGQEQQPQQQQGRGASPVPVSQLQKQQEQVDNRMESFHMNNDGNDGNDPENLDTTQEHFQLLPLTRLPKSRQEHHRAGTIIANECNTSRLVYNMPMNPTQEEIDIVQQKIYNNFIKTPRNSKAKPLIELFKELGIIAMNCANEVQTINDYQRAAVDILAEALRKRFHAHAELFRKHEDIRLKSKRIKLTHDHAEKRLINATSSRRKLNDEINEMRKRCEKLRAEREIDTNIIKFFDRLNSPIPEMPDDVSYEEINVIKIANEEQHTKGDVRPEEINVSQYTTDGHEADNTDVSETSIKTIGD